MKSSSHSSPRLLSISHSAVLGGYRERYSEVARQSGIEISLLVPRRWRQFNRMIELAKTPDSNYRIIARQPITWGMSKHGLRNVTHVYPGLNRLLGDLRPDIVELWEEPFSAVTVQAIRGAGKTAPGAKIIFFSAQNIRKNYPPPFAWFEKYTYHRADFAFAISRAAAAVIREKGWKKETVVLPLGVNPEVFQPLDASGLRRELDLNQFTVGFIGKLERQKGILNLIQAAGRIRGEINLLIIGSGPLRNKATQLAEKMGLTEETRFISAVPYDKMSAYLNCLDVLVLPSVTQLGLKEQFGRVLIEAMSCGVPVIGSNSGEIPNVIGNAGLIFSEGDPEKLAEKIDLLRRDPARRKKLSELGQARVRENYSWAKIAKKQVAVYHRLLQGKN